MSIFLSLLLTDEYKIRQNKEEICLVLLNFRALHRLFFSNKLENTLSLDNNHASVFHQFFK